MRSIFQEADYEIQLDPSYLLTGTGVKANQGRNAAVYTIREERIRRGRATDAFFRAADAKIASLSSGK